ncbi:MAG: hypothetical protein E3J72_08680 [Planctomycetota bacterium]|nr:MAG: hypothetical protein E3J72_08680 [Planctomycetota bacterium]
MRARMFFVCLITFAFALGCAQKSFVLADIPSVPDVTAAAALAISTGPLPDSVSPSSGHVYVPIYGGIRMSLITFARDGQFDPTVKFDIFTFFEATKYLMLEGALGFTALSADTDPDGWLPDSRGLGDGSFFFMPLTFSAYLNLPIAISLESESTRSLVDLYLGGGAGLYLIDFDVAADAVHDAEAIYGLRYYDQWVDSTVAFHIAGGLNIFLNEQAAINVDLRYVMGMAQTHWQAYNTSAGVWMRDDDWVDIHHLQIGVGLCVEF